ncbi:MAG TPA: MYXO-CTERM sorting domain-containing protein, partial [Kofleriaceae bacterium]
WSASASINDNTAPGSSWAGRGVDKIYDVCTAADSSVLGTGLQPGIHDVKITATVPGSTIALAAPDLSVELAVCPTPDDGDVSGENESGCNASGGALGPLALVGVMLLLHGSRRR